MRFNSVNTWRFNLFGLAIGAAVVITGCTEEKPQRVPSVAVKPAVPVIDTSNMQPRVASRIREAQQAVTREPDSAEAWGRLGKVCHVHREHDPATVCYREARRLSPDDFRWAYFLARVLELEGRAGDEVIELYEAAIDLNPSYAPAHSRLGDALVREGRIEDGRLVLAKAVRLDPNLAKARRSLGQVLLMLEQVDRALVHLEMAGELSPTDGAVWSALAQAYTKNGNKLRAAGAATKAATLKPIHALNDPAMQEVSDEGISSAICAKRARAYTSHGDFENALSQLLIVAEVESENANLHQRIASVALRAHRPNVAIKYLNLAIVLDRKNVATRSRLADLLLQQGRKADALLHLQRSVAEIPENSELHALLGGALAQSGQLPEAIAEFERAAQFGELSPRAYNNWGNALRASGVLEDAVDQYQAALKLDPKYANAHYNLGSTLERLDRVETAIQHYRAAVKLDPNHPAKASLDRLLSNAP